jgi:8-oxo-dGTP pyrophosphatase MutT (NUDIX family)
MKSRLFIGSSVESIDVAYAIQENLEHDSDCTVWNQGVFDASQIVLQRLVDTTDVVDFAVFVLTSDDLVSIHNTVHTSVRDNVLFEFGLFLGSLGSQRVFLVRPRNEPALRVPTDLFGLVMSQYYTHRSDDNLAAALGPACNQIRRAIHKLGPRPAHKTDPTLSEEDVELIGLRRVYQNYIHAEPDIIHDLTTSPGPIRLFLQIGGRDVAARGTVADLLNDRSHATNVSDLLLDANIDKTVEVQILHADIQSPLFSRERLESLGKNPSDIAESLRHVHRNLERLTNSTSSIRHRTHSFPFVWRIYAVDRRLYVMPYLSEKDAHQRSPVLMFEKSTTSLYNAFIRWFDHMWESHAPKSVGLKDYVTSATPAGTALFLKWQDMHVFAIPERDMQMATTSVRFYGVGGKRRGPDEPLLTCALREGNEETGGAISQLINAPYTDFWDANGVINRIPLVEDGFRPRLILQKIEHTGRGLMARDDDFYYLVAYDAAFAKQPVPTGEVGALLFLANEHLIRANRNDVTLRELVSAGARLAMRPGLSELMESMVLIPHGTAAYLCRQMSKDADK